MSRQERSARRARWAKEQTSDIVKEKAEKVVARRTTPVPSQDQAQQVKELRDGGMAWWAIGQKLGLSGKAQNASDPEAKKGAGQARKLYAAANRGVVPRSHAQRAGTTARPQGPGRSGSATDRKLMLVEQGHVIPRDTPDEEVEAMVVGRRIEWAIDLARLTETDPATWGPEDTRWVRQEARVHIDPRWVKVFVPEEGQPRLLHFREYLGYDKDRQRDISGPTRTIRVDSIYTIR